MLAGLIRRFCAELAAASFVTLVPSWAAAAPEATGSQREEIEAWLDSNAVEADVARAEEPEEGLPPPPRHHGLLIETGIGAAGHLGDLQQVSPLSPRFSLLVGYEFVEWALLFAEGDAIFSNTSYAPEPPDSRGYVLFGFGAGARFTLEVLDWLGAFVQGSAGVARVNEDVLATYGYRNATELSPYFGAQAGVRAYLPSPHLRFLIEGGVRNYQQGLDREVSARTPLAWMVGPALGYAF